MSGVRFAKSFHSRSPRELVATFGQLTLVGTSVAAQATAFAIPELGVALDVGRLTPTIAQQPTLLLTHAHLDHTAGILAYLNVRSRFPVEEETTVWVPAPMHRQLFEALRLFPGTGSLGKRLDLEKAVRPIESGQEISWRGFLLQAFAVQHGVFTLGWRLTPLGAERPAVVFASDGDPRFFFSHPDLLRAQVVVVECSFLGKNRRIAARLSQHAHILDWVELAPQLDAQVLVLAHLPRESPSIRELHHLVQAFAGTVVVWAEKEAGKP